MPAAVDAVALPAQDRTPVVARPSSSVSPLIAWLLLQGAALGLAAARVPLSAHYPQAGERLAIDLLLAAQIGGSAALFPLLLRNGRSTMATICSAWPFLAFAAVLSALPASRTLTVAGFVTVWLIVLGLWNTGLRTVKWRFVASAVAVLATVGGALLWYLRVEFTAPGGGSPSPDGRYGPLVAALELASGHQTGFTSTWLPLTIAALLGLFSNISRIRRRV